MTIPARSLGRQVGGTHYSLAEGPQPVEFIERNGLGFLEGSVVKRVFRWRRDGGKGSEDLRKAIHELELLLELNEGRRERVPKLAAGR